jgi:hypothetical protein
MTATAHAMIVHAGAVNRDHVHIPVSPAQFVSVARRAISEGAQFTQIAERIRDLHCAIVETHWRSANATLSA